MIGDRVRALREARSWTQSHLADASELSLRTIQRLETAHSAAPETVLSIASALGVDVSAILDEGDNTSIPVRPARSWWALSPRLAATIGALLTLPCAAFIAANLLKFEASTPWLYDGLAGIGSRLGISGAFVAISPGLLLGGPVVALLVNTAAVLRPRGEWTANSVTLTGIEIRLNAAGIAVGLIALASLAVLGSYLIVENLGHFARAPS